LVVLAQPSWSNLTFILTVAVTAIAASACENR
jgi:hypothetical protein